MSVLAEVRDSQRSGGGWSGRSSRYVDADLSKADSPNSFKTQDENHCYNGRSESLQRAVDLLCSFLNYLLLFSIFNLHRHESTSEAVTNGTKIKVYRKYCFPTLLTVINVTPVFIKAWRPLHLPTVSTTSITALLSSPQFITPRCCTTWQARCHPRWWLKSHDGSIAVTDSQISRTVS